MDAKEKFDHFISKKGLRRTAPRDIVAKIFLETEKHVSTEELYNIVHKKHENIGYATVSRTMKLLEEADLCRKVDFGDGVVRFEHKYKHQHHDHLVCTGCGKLVEIYDEKLEKIQDQLVKEHGFMQESHRLNIYGLCPKCRQNSSR